MGGLQSIKNAMVISDLDGTLYPRGGPFNSRDLQILESLSKEGITRVIATGRSLYSLKKVVAPDFPIDYLIFSSGAGIMDWRSKKLLKVESLKRAEVQEAAVMLKSRDLDFMIHSPIPENHFFTYYPSGRDNPDFESRCLLYTEFATPGSLPAVQFPAACQLLAIENENHRESLYEEIKNKLKYLKVIRTTSPLNGRSTWIEIFPETVSKGLASSWLASSLGLKPDQVMALGNDYNDLDLLHWAGQSYVVESSPAELKENFSIITAARMGENFTAAVQCWLKEHI